MVAIAGFVSAGVGALAGALADALILNGDFAVLLTALGAAVGGTAGWYLLGPKGAARTKDLARLSQRGVN
jgi:hypothetical protein